jgi:nucleoside-diphosphate-sugar epimerase
MTRSFIPKRDISEILKFSPTSLSKLQNSTVTIFGGSGFVGRWLVSSLLAANSELSNNVTIEIVTSNVQRVRDLFSPAKSSEIIYTELENYSSTETFSQYIFHSATPTTNSAHSIGVSHLLPVRIAKDIVRKATICKNYPRVVHLNSGAVYGEQPINVRLQLESDSTLKNSDSPYISAKLKIDEIFGVAEQDGLISYRSPRLYAFAGPHLPLDAHFAVGNFLSSALKREPIRINGNPATTRSYLYPVDLIHCLLEMAVTEFKSTVNIGSDTPISMFQLAEEICQNIGKVPILLLGENAIQSNYVPSVKNLRQYITDKKFISLDESLNRWNEWLNS